MMSVGMAVAIATYKADGITSSGKAQQHGEGDEGSFCDSQTVTVAWNKHNMSGINEDIHCQSRPLNVCTLPAGDSQKG